MAAADRYVEVPGPLGEAIDRLVGEGVAPSRAAFVEEAICRLIAELGGDEIRDAALSGIADIEAGRYTSIETSADREQFRARTLARLRTRLAIGG